MKMANVKNLRKQTALEPNKQLCRIRREWWIAVLVCALILLGGFSIVNYGRSNQNGLQWILQTAFVTIYALGLLRAGLPLNYHPKKKVLHSTLGYGTWITIIRAMLIALLAGYLFQPWPKSLVFPGRLSWAPGALYTTASILDYLDGLVARAGKQETHLGAYLDINIDALGLLIAPLLAVWYGQLPIAYLGVSAAYYLFVVGIRLRKKYSKPVFKLEPRRSARIIAGIQMGFVGIALFPVFSPPVTIIVAYLLMVPLLAGFVRDWCFVCGYLRTDYFHKTSRKHFLKFFFTQ
jgi:CDP-diacylglycerol--glycerol-3-phosphate 3-phosphatidyltransferase